MEIIKHQDPRHEVSRACAVYPSRRGRIAMRYLWIFALATGCMATLTPQGQSVRVVTAAQKEASCRYVGLVTASQSLGLTTGGDAQSALNGVRNRAAALGANAILIVSTDSDAIGTTVVAEALDCRFDE